ncbi:MAG: hypothetical protein HYV04_00025 [Deltaproteobacteria bacterium]|nr:hypothetical protein [Deltaproteobacteria bacterium]
MKSESLWRRERRWRRATIAIKQSTGPSTVSPFFGQPLFSQVPVNIRSIHVIRELGINLRKEEQIFSNRAVLGIIPDALENLLNDHSRREDMIAPAQAVFQKGILPGDHAAEEINPD